MINDFLFQYFYELLNLFSNVEIYKWNKGNELTSIWLYVSKIFVWYLWSGTCTPSPFLKNEIDKCVGYEKKNNSKTKLRKIGASLFTHFQSNRMQMLAFSPPTIISAFCSISWFVKISKKQSSDLSL